MNHSPLLSFQQRFSFTNTKLVLVSAVGGEWELPTFYDPSGAWAEYDAATQPGGAGLADRSWRSVLRVRGRDRLTFLQGMVSQDVASLAPGQGAHAALLDSTGHILADLRIHATEDAVLIDADPRCAARAAELLDKYLIMEKAVVEDVTDQWGILSVIGPGARALLEKTYSLTLPNDLAVLGHAPLTIGGGPGLIVRHPLGDVAAYDVWAPRASLVTVWEELTKSGAVPVGEQALEMLRVEAAIPAWGSELDPAVLLPEAEMADAVSYSKGCYVGQEIVARIHARGHTNKALRSVLFGDDARPAAGDLIYDVSGESEIGRVTSAALSPRFGGRALTLAYVRKEHFDPGSEVAVRNGHGELLSAKIVAPPFSELTHETV
ncbi:CAF17-like 4Fe-4S cluster assembly/insertion protein YgfZ [Capsulimonas corticalis]|nr:aminomethyl transferase family protein [Capsulimonas corticalis]